jgi:hypothetical protein
MNFALRECFLSPFLVIIKSFDHGDHRDHRDFLMVFSVFSVYSVVKKPLRNSLGAK